MTFEHKPNSGSLFPNDRKEKDTHPDFTGSAMINGVEMWISAWKNEKGGKHRLGISFKPKDEHGDPQMRDGNPSQEPPTPDSEPPNPFG